MTLSEIFSLDLQRTSFNSGLHFSLLCVCVCVCVFHGNKGCVAHYLTIQWDHTDGDNFISH